MSGNNELDIWRCGLSSDQIFEKPCPLTWERLRPTDSPSIRHCETCDHNVYEVRTPEEFLKRAKAKDCVAIFAPLTRELGPTGMLGSPRPWDWNLEASAKQWWAEIGKDASPEFSKMIYKEAENRNSLIIAAELLAEEADSFPPQSPAG